MTPRASGKLKKLLKILKKSSKFLNSSRFENTNSSKNPDFSGLDSKFQKIPRKKFLDLRKILYALDKITQSQKVNLRDPRVLRDDNPKV